MDALKTDGSKMDASKMNRESDFFFFKGDRVTGEQIFKNFTEEVDEKLIYKDSKGAMKDVTKNIDKLIKFVSKDNPENKIQQFSEGTIINLIDESTQDCYEIYDSFTTNGGFNVPGTKITKFFNKDFSDMQDLLDNINDSDPEKYNFKLIYYGFDDTYYGVFGPETKKEVISRTMYFRENKNSKKSTFFFFKGDILKGEEIYNLLTKESDGKFTYEDANGNIHDVTENTNKFIDLVLNDNQDKSVSYVPSDTIINTIDRQLYADFEVYDRFTKNGNFKSPGIDSKQYFRKDFSDLGDLMEAINHSDPEKYNFKFIW
jgi:hypothetical protein